MLLCHDSGLIKYKVVFFPLSLKISLIGFIILCVSWVWKQLNAWERFFAWIFQHPLSMWILRSLCLRQIQLQTFSFFQSLTQLYSLSLSTVSFLQKRSLDHTGLVEKAVSACCQPKLSPDKIYLRLDCHWRLICSNFSFSKFLCQPLIIVFSGQIDLTWLRSPNNG